MKDYYRKLIVELIDKIHSEKALCRIYNFAERLYMQM